MGQVPGRLPACIFNSSSPVTANISAANANTSMNRLQAGAGVASLVQIVQVRQPTAIRELVRDLAVFQIYRQPGVAAGARQRHVDFVVRPFGLAIGGSHRQRFAEPINNRCGQRRLFIGVLTPTPSSIARATAAGSSAVCVVTSGFAPIHDAWLSVKPVMLNNTIPIKHIAALIQCHWCKVFQPERPGFLHLSGRGA